MSTPALAVVVALRGTDEADLVRGLADHRSQVEVIARCADLADVLVASAGGRAQAAVLSADLHQLDGVALDRLRRDGCAVVVLVPPGSEHAERRMRQLGVRQVLTMGAGPAEVVTAVLDETRTLMTAVDGPATIADGRSGRRLLSRVADAGSPAAVASGAGAEDVRTPDLPLPERPGQVVAVWGPAGAPGRTTTAVSLAAELAGQGGALVVDADTYAAGVGQVLGLLDEAPGLVAAARSADHGTLDLPALSRLAPEVAPGLRVLTGLVAAHRWPDLRGSSLQVVLGLCRSLVEWTVVDTSFCLEQDEELTYDTVAPRRNGATLAALEAADVVVAVGSADPVGLARLVRGLRSLAEVGVASPLVVVTRVRGSAVGAGSGTGSGAADRVSEALERYAGVTNPLLVPYDRASTDAALLAGRTLVESAPSSAVRQAYQVLAEQISGSGRVPGRGRGHDRGAGRWAGRWRGRRSMLEGRDSRRHQGARA